MIGAKKGGKGAASQCGEGAEKADAAAASADSDASDESRRNRSERARGGSRDAASQEVKIEDADSDEEDEVSGEDALRRDLAASGAELFDDEEDDDQPILGGPPSTPSVGAASSARGGSSGSRRWRGCCVRDRTDGDGAVVVAVVVVVVDVAVSPAIPTSDRASNPRIGTSVRRVARTRSANGDSQREWRLATVSGRRLARWTSIQPQAIVSVESRFPRSIRHAIRSLLHRAP